MLSSQKKAFLKFGAPGRIRTCDLPVRSRALYPLSYKRIILLKHPLMSVSAFGTPSGIRTLDTLIKSQVL